MKSVPLLEQLKSFKLLINATYAQQSEILSLCPCSEATIMCAVEGCIHGVQEVDQFGRVPVVFQVRWEDVFVELIIARRAHPFVGNCVLHPYGSFWDLFFVSGTRPSFISSIDTKFAACGFVFVEQKGTDSLPVFEHSEAWSDNLQVLEDKGNFWRLVWFWAVYRVCIALCIALSL